MLYIDASRYSNTEKRTGVENYSYFLIRALIKQHPDEITLITPRKIDLDVTQIVIPFPRLWTHLRLSWEIFKNKKIQNLFVPSHVLPLIHAKKSVLTIHDVAFKHSAKSYGWLSRTYLDWSTKFAVKHAWKIIVPSQKTKNDLIEFYACPPKKITVIPLGFEAPEYEIKLSEIKSTLSKFKLRSKGFFLYIGRIEHKKNSDTLLKAFGKFASYNSIVDLCMAGFPGHGGKEILEAIPETSKKRVILPGYISEREKQILLREALCFVFPSREEGFGIPLLEAMNANLPIIASDIPASRELASEVADFFPPENSESLFKLMLKVSQDKKTKKDYSELLKKYSWDHSAREVYRLLTI